ncbi:MAG TPA: glycoside hydrolase family 43 protein [Lachnospiraceae bacterium]|nr:glycoside hydrolase family 43 protein [Lachnospiraceae bacterium]
MYIKKGSTSCEQTDTIREIQQTEEAESIADGKQDEEEKRSDQMNANYTKLFEKLEMTESFKGLDHTNPCMTQRFGADPYALVYGDRVYFYMTGDSFEYDATGNVTENTYSKINTIQVISTNDMVNFTDHGSIKAASGLGCAKWASNSWAPAAAWKEIDGKPQFFLYFADSARGIGVLTADSPTGPFKDPLDHALITKKVPNCETIEWLFDPAVLVDDDGRSYLYFGGGVPKDKIERPGTARVVELGADMISIVGEPQVIDAPYLFEDSGIHKAGNKYYYTYCSHWQVDQKGTKEYGFHNGEIVCMESNSPMGPFTFKETILKNPGEYSGLFGNNHHCVFSFQGNWYMTYHTRVLEKAMGIQKGYRCTHIDGFEMQEDGTIGFIKQTLEGREQLRYVNPYEENSAVNFAVMGGVSSIGADSISSYYGCGDMALSDIHTGDFIKVQGVDFGSETPKSFAASVRRSTEDESVIQIRIDGLDGQVLGYLPVTGDLEKEFSLEASVLLSDTPVTGVHDLFFLFYGEGYEIKNWKFN